MIMRTQKTSVTFASSFTLEGRDEIFPPGTYAVETEEQLLEGLTFTAFRRTQVSIRFPATSGHSATARMLILEPKQLDAAIERDRIASKRAATCAAVARTAAEAHTLEADIQAVDRAEDEGMFEHSP